MNLMIRSAFARLDTSSTKIPEPANHVLSLIQSAVCVKWFLLFGNVLNAEIQRQC